MSDDERCTAVLHAMIPGQHFGAAHDVGVAIRCGRDRHDDDPHGHEGVSVDGAFRFVDVRTGAKR